MPQQGAFPVIALVGSTGSVRATESILAALPCDLGAAVIVVIHHSPDQAPALLPDLLRSSSALPVSPAVDGNPLAPSEVFVVPPGRHRLIDHARTMRLIDAGRPPPNRPSADLLMVSLATAVGADAVAVVLSGNGHDGATGAAAIRHFGGRTLVTSEASSEAFAMPHAAMERDDDDQDGGGVVDLEVLPARLVALVTGAEPAPEGFGSRTADA